MVYSFGSDGDWSFEAGVKYLAPDSSIFTFDPKLSPEKKDRVLDAEKKGVLRFVDVGLWGGDTSGAHDFSFLPNLNMSKMLSMPSIRARLSHATRELDVRPFMASRYCESVMARWAMLVRGIIVFGAEKPARSRWNPGEN